MTFIAWSFTRPISHKNHHVTVRLTDLCPLFRLVKANVNPRHTKQQYAIYAIHSNSIDGFQNGPSTEQYHKAVSGSQAHYSSRFEENNRLAIDNFHWIAVFDRGKGRTRIVRQTKNLVACMETHIQRNLSSPVGPTQVSPELRLGWGLLTINQQIKYIYFLFCLDICCSHHFKQLDVYKKIMRNLSL